MWCVFSALLFGMVAFVTQGCWLSPAFGSLMVTSIAYHGTRNMDYVGKTQVARFDKLLAYAVTLRCIYNSFGMPLTFPIIAFWSGISWMAYVYHIAKLSHHPKCGDMWHSSLHVGAAVAALGLYYGRYA